MVYYISLLNYIERTVILKGLRSVCWCHNQKSNKNNNYYVVIEGQAPGIYTSWAECQNQVHGYSKSKYKKFTGKGDALLYMEKELDVLKTTSCNKKTSINILENILAQYKNLWKEEYAKVEELSGGFVSATEFTRESLTFDSEGYLEVYTDGACSNNGRTDAVASIAVYFGDGSELNTSAMLDGKVTNNIAEIRAVIMGLTKAREAGYDKVKILTDSEYVLLCLTRWMKKWKKNDWRKIDGDSVLNKEDLVELDQILSTMDVKWVHVRGHQDVQGNNRADQMARNCIRKWKEEELAGKKEL